MAVTGMAATAIQATATTVVVRRPVRRLAVGTLAHLTTVATAMVVTHPIAPTGVTEHTLRADLGKPRSALSGNCARGASTAECRTGSRPLLMPSVWSTRRSKIWARRKARRRSGAPATIWTRMAARARITSVEFNPDLRTSSTEALDLSRVELRDFEGVFQHTIIGAKHGRQR